MIMPAVGGLCPKCQTVAVLNRLGHAIKKLGGAMSDVVRTRVVIHREQYLEAVSQAHGRLFWSQGVCPANTFTIARVIDEDMLVEIEAEAVVGSGKSVVVVD